MKSSGCDGGAFVVWFGTFIHWESSFSLFPERGWTRNEPAYMRVIEGKKQWRNGWNEKRGEGMGKELGREWWKREKEGAAGRKRYSKDEGKKGDEKGSEQARRKGRWSYGNGKFERCATGGQKEGQRRTDVGSEGEKREVETGNGH